MTIHMQAYEITKTDGALSVERRMDLDMMSGSADGAVEDMTLSNAFALDPTDPLIVYLVYDPSIVSSAEASQ